MWIYGLAVAIALFDYITKAYVQCSFILGESIPIIPDIFHLTYIINYGAAFGILENQRGLFLLIVGILIGLCIWKNRKIQKFPFHGKIGLALLLGGALGNGYDRYRMNGVVDFFDFRIWPIFNIADIAICIGVTLLAWYFWHSKE